MSVQVLNDLVGVVTYGEAIAGLAAAYDELTLQGRRAAASRVNDFRNKLAGKVVVEDSDWYGNAPGTYRYDQGLSPRDKKELRELQDWLEAQGSGSGRHFDPDAKEASIGKIVRPFAFGSGLVLAVLAVLFFWRR